MRVGCDSGSRSGFTGHPHHTNVVSCNILHCVVGLAILPFRSSSEMDQMKVEEEVPCAWARHTVACVEIPALASRSSDCWSGNPVHVFVLLRRSGIRRSPRGLRRAGVWERSPSAGRFFPLFVYSHHSLGDIRAGKSGRVTWQLFPFQGIFRSGRISSAKPRKISHFIKSQSAKQG